MLKIIQNKETQIDGSSPSPAQWLILGNTLAATWGHDKARFLWLKHEEHQGKLKREARARLLTDMFFVALLPENASDLSKAEVCRHRDYEIEKGVE